MRSESALSVTTDAKPGRPLGHVRTPLQGRPDDGPVQWREGLRVSAFEQVRAGLDITLDCEPYVVRAMSDLVRHVFLSGRASTVPRSVAFIPVRRANDCSLLAAAAAEALAAEVTETVCLVDADLRAPSLDSRFGILRAPGVSDLLVHRSIPAPVTLRGNWYLMPAGTCCLEAVRLLATGRGDPQLRRLFRQCARTVIYEPPLAESADASRLGSLVDGVVLVVNESMTASRLRTVAGRLESAGARLVGAVLYTPKNRIFEALDRWF